jgi:hypothetical protein
MKLQQQNQCYESSDFRAKLGLTWGYVRGAEIASEAAVWTWFGMIQVNWTPGGSLK